MTAAIYLRFNLTRTIEAMRHFVIGGTEKAGTTSIFQYLCCHSQIIPSSKKETDFFRQSIYEPKELDVQQYYQYFSLKSEEAYCMEASPGYLVDSKYSAPAIRYHIPNARLLFVLRDPIERLCSSYQFHRSRFYLSDKLTIGRYVELCLQYEQNGLTPEQAGIKEWFLRVLNAGCYHQHLVDFYSMFPVDQIMVVTFDELKSNPEMLLKRICQFLEISADVFEHQQFEKSNVTFEGKNRSIHRFGLYVNKQMESIFIKRPEVKRKLLRIYKKLNGKQPEHVVIPTDTIDLLSAYYRNDLNSLLTLPGIPKDIICNWRTLKEV